MGDSEKSESNGTISGPVKICFVSPLGYGLYNQGAGRSYGGAEVQFFLLANVIAGDPSYEVSILTTVDHQPGVEHHGGLTLFKRLGQGRLRAKSAQGPLDLIRLLTGFLSAFGDMWQQFRRINADVYVHAGAGVEVGAYALICRLLQKRFLFFIASSADLWEPYGGSKGPLKWLFPLGIRFAHGIVCRSEEQKQQLWATHGRKGLLIRTGHPLPALRTELRSSILWVGRGVPLKQPDLFLDLAKQLPGQSFVMVVSHELGEEGLTQRIRERAKEIPNVALHENVPLNEMEQYFAHARIFVNTSTYEGFPNTFVQAALNGVPVVSWRVDPDRLLSQEILGLCAGGSFDRLLELVRELCATAEKRERLGQRAQDHAYRHHDVKQSAAALKAHVRSLVGRTS